MKALTRPDIQRALLNVSKRERSAVTVPPEFASTDWTALDFYGWRDPRFPQRGYLVRDHDDALVAVAVSTSEGGLPPGRKAMCSICRAVDNSTAVALFSARRAGPAGRKGDSVGTYICRDLDCSVHLRHPTDRIGRTRLGSDQDVEVVAADMLVRLDHFLDAVRAA